MCYYCGNQFNGESIELIVNDVPLYFCHKDCIIQYYQEQQERNFRSWVNFR